MIAPAKTGEKHLNDVEVTRGAATIAAAIKAVSPDPPQRENCEDRENNPRSRQRGQQWCQIYPQSPRELLPQLPAKPYDSSTTFVRIERPW
jgi:hypothetical protein